MLKRILLLFIAVVFLASIIPSTEAIFNTKFYDDSTKKLEIRDWGGIGNYLTARLVYNTDSCLIDCRSEIEITLYQNLDPEDVLDNLKFLDLNNENKISSIDYTLKTEITEIVEVADWGICYKDIKIKLPNGTRERLAYSCLKGTTHKEARTKLVGFYDVKTYEKGKTYKIYLTGKKPQELSVDWIFDIGGIEADEFAWWNSSIYHKRKIDFNYTSLSADHNNNVTLPINISTSTETTQYLDSLCNGTRFTNSSEDSQLQYEYDNTTHASSGCNTGSTVAWVRFEGWDNDANNSLYWYFNNDTNNETSNTIWNTDLGQNYTAVYQGELYDRSPNTFDLTDGGTANITPHGKYGYGYDSANSGKFNTSSPLTNGVNTFSVAFWYYPREVDVDKTIVFEGLDGDNGWGIYQRSAGVGRVGFNVNGGACNLVNNTPSINNWHHIAAVLNGGVCNLYINGTLVNSGGSGISTYSNPPYNFTMFAGTTETYYATIDAILDDVQVFGKALAPDEIELMYQAGTNGLNQFTYGRETYATYNAITNHTNTTEGEVLTYIANITLHSGNSSATAYLIYNNTAYEAGLTSSTNLDYVFSRVLSTPNILDTNLLNETRSYYWSIVDGVAIHNSTPVNQTVLKPYLTTTKTAESIATLNFTIHNEGHPFTRVTSYLDMYAKIYPSTNESQQQIYNFSLSGQSNYTFFLQPAYAEYNITADIYFYSDTPVASDNRFYYLRNTSISNQTRNVNLYLLNDSSSTTFEVTVLDSSYNEVEGAIVKVQRNYIGYSGYTQVNEGFTDTDGFCLLQLQLDDALYKFLIEQNGVPLFDTLPTTISCDIALEVCTLTIIESPAKEDEFTIFDEITGLTYNTDYNNNTYLFSFTWSQSQGTSVDTMIVATQEQSIVNTSIANITGSGASGTINANLTGHNGTFLLEYYANDGTGYKKVGQSYIHIHAGEKYGLTGVFLAWLIILIMFFIGIWSPKVSIVLLLITFGLLMWIDLILVGSVSLIAVFVLSLIALWRMK